MIEFWNDFLHDKETFVNVVAPILTVVFIIAIFTFIAWITKD